MIDFMKRNKILTTVFGICIYLMIKNSSIPYLFEPPIVISLLFDAPKSELFSAIAPLVDIFTSAYVTSLVFYVFIEYIPALEQEKKAKDVLKPQLVNLYLYISELLAIIEYSAKMQKISTDNNMSELDRLLIKDKEILCNRQTSKNDEIIEKAAYSYNLLKDGNNLRNLALNICKDIAATPSLSYCDSEFIHIISEIQLSELLKMLPKPGDILSKMKFDVSYLGLGESYQKLEVLQNKLRKYVDVRYDYVMLEISKEEIEEWQNTQAESLKEHPEILALLLELQKENT